MRRPRTGWGLFAEVARQIEREPLQYYQDAWHIPTTVLEQVEGGERYAGTCGTAHCVAGWCEVVMGAPLTQSAGSSVKEALGWPSGPIYHDLTALFDTESVAGTAGSQAYANRGARRVRAFMKKHERVLKTTKLQVPA